VVLDVAVVGVVTCVVLVPVLPLDDGEVRVVVGDVLDSLQATTVVPAATVRTKRPTVCRHFAIFLNYP
jgi:hypothetical protein